MAQLSVLMAGYNHHSKSLLVADAAPEMIAVPIPIFCIKSGKFNILVDTGPDPDLKLPVEKTDGTTRTEDQRIENLLAKINLTTDDIDYVIVTHLHFDHAGSLKEFKKSKIIVQNDEFHYAFWPDWFFMGVYEQSDFNYPYLNYELIKGDYDLTKDVKIISIPGHTPGTQGVFIRLDSGKKVILTSDACYTLENFGPPKRLPGLMMDARKWGASIERIRHLAELEEAEVWPGHDNDFYTTKVKFAPYRYE